MLTLLQKFENDQQRRGLQPNTILLRHRQIELFEVKVGPLGAASPDEIQEFLDSQRTFKGNPICDKTRSCYLTTFSSFFKWAIKHDELRINPIEKIDRPHVHNGLPNPIPEIDLARALAACEKPMVKCWIALEAYAGLRCQEVAFLEHEDVQTAENRIYVRRGKGGEQRYVSGIHPMIAGALAAYNSPTSTGRMWPTATPASVSQRINRFFRAIGITHTAHKNRHRFVTRVLATSGGNLIAAQRAAGHKNVSTTQIYAGIDDSEVRSAVMAI